MIQVQLFMYAFTGGALPPLAVGTVALLTNLGSFMRAVDSVLLCVVDLSEVLDLCLELLHLLAKLAFADVAAALVVTLTALLKLADQMSVFIHNLPHPGLHRISFQPHLPNLLKQRFFPEVHRMQISAISLLNIWLVSRPAIIANHKSGVLCSYPWVLD